MHASLSSFNNCIAFQEIRYSDFLKVRKQRFRVVFIDLGIDSYSSNFKFDRGYTLEMLKNVN